ncbi:unnamed protein product [Thlaspi arvense]|uniref:Protein TRANSPARENT TESTA 12 n=1 Tax=Thlaspi arvense TaxID=13288 RepID=A0AAU9RHJ8_THLAR|nr:unnamed protein product [Thlaspi arvense]
MEETLEHIRAAIFSRLTSYSMVVVTQAFAGHLGDVELAAISIAYNLLICQLGMASALETLCGQAFGAGQYYMMGVYLQRSWVVLFLCCVLALPIFIFASPMWLSSPVPWLCEVLAEPVKSAVLAWVSLAALAEHVIVSWVVVYGCGLGVVGSAVALCFSWWVLTLGLFGYTVVGGALLLGQASPFKRSLVYGDFFKLSAASGVMICL